MADLVTISVSTEVWEKRLAAYMVTTGKGIRQAMDEEWPLLVRKLIDFTPPFKSGGLPGASDLSVGRAAVARDILKTMRPFDPKTIREPRLATIVAEKNFDAFDAIAARSASSFMAGLRAIAFAPDVHLRARNDRGRVGGGDRRQAVLGSDAALLKSYITEVQSHVGFAKAGWSKAYNLVQGDGKPLPAYVSRQSTSGGDVIDDRDNPDNPSITAINHTPWSERYDEGQRAKAAAFASRGEAIKSKIATAIRIAKEEAGFHGPSGN